MNPLKQQVIELIAQQGRLAAEAAGCFNMPVYQGACRVIAEMTEFLASLAD